jgi:hypothetical protein
MARREGRAGLNISDRNCSLPASPCSDGVLAAFFVVEDELHRDAGIAGPLGRRRMASVAAQVARIAAVGRSGTRWGVWTWRFALRCCGAAARRRGRGPRVEAQVLLDVASRWCVISFAARRGSRFSRASTICHVLFQGVLGRLRGLVHQGDQRRPAEQVLQQAASTSLPSMRARRRGSRPAAGCGPRRRCAPQRRCSSRRCTRSTAICGR